MIQTSILIMLLNIVIVSNLWAHGEDKLGPHGGVIRMPGGFHTEIKLHGNNAFDLYILDLHWKNPLVVGTTLKAKWKRSGKKEILLSCKTEQINYTCKLPEASIFTSGDIVTIEASRPRAPGVPVTYQYPFEPTVKEIKKDHHGH